jgi:hypothetical protein
VKGKTDRYRDVLRELGGMAAWEVFLLAESALPGPRANLELVEAAVEEGDRALFLALLHRAPPAAAAGRMPDEAGTLGPASGGSASPSPADPRREFLAVCGAAGLGRVLAEGDATVLPVLRTRAGDPRWRVREGVAMALQRWGDADPAALLAVMAEWSTGSRYEQRAVVAGLCEPRLLRVPEVAGRVLMLLDRITGTLAGAADRREEPFRVLRKALAYGWSVAAVADPSAGLPLMERWLRTPDPDIRWVMRQNLAKARLRRAAPEWVAEQCARLEGGPPRPRI